MEESKSSVAINLLFVDFLELSKLKPLKNVIRWNFDCGFGHYQKKIFLQYNLFKFKLMFLCYSKLKTSF